MIGQDGQNHADADAERDDNADATRFTRRGANDVFPLLSLSDLAHVGSMRPEELIPGKLLKRSLALLYGDSGTGKSYYAQHEAFTLAAGGAPVWYVAGEGFDGLYLRIQAWLAAHPGASLAPLCIIPLPVQIFKGADASILAAQARDLPPAARDLPPAARPQLVVLDTLHRCVRGARENDNSDMGCLGEAAALWRGEFGATTWAIHHEGKNAGAGLRGASCLLDDSDTVMYVFRGGDISVVEAEKQRDGLGLFAPEAFTVESHSLERAGYPGLSAGIVRPLDASHIVEARRLWTAAQQRRLPGGLKNAAVGEDDTAALSDTVARGLAVLARLAPDHPDGVLKGTWRPACEAAGIKAGSFEWMVKELLRRGKVRALTDTAPSRFLLVDATSSATSN